MAAGDKKDILITRMIYNSVSDELFLADRNNGVVRVMRVRDNASDLRDVYRAPHDTLTYKFYNECKYNERVLIGQPTSPYMELFRVESGPRIALVYRIHVLEVYHWFPATCGSDTLVAMTYFDQSVGVVQTVD